MSSRTTRVFESGLVMVVLLALECVRRNLKVWSIIVGSILFALKEMWLEPRLAEEVQVVLRRDVPAPVQPAAAPVQAAVTTRQLPKAIAERLVPVAATTARSLQDVVPGSRF